MGDSLAHRVYVAVYTSYCLIIGSQQFNTMSTYANLLLFDHRISLHQYAKLGVTPEQRVFFFMISGYEIAEGIIRYVHGTFSGIYMLHHLLHLVAYAYGGLVRRCLGWAFMVHLLLCEWRDIVCNWTK